MFVLDLYLLLLVLGLDQLPLQMGDLLLEEADLALPVEGFRD